MSGIQSVRIF